LFRSAEFHLLWLPTAPALPFADLPMDSARRDAGESDRQCWKMVIADGTKPV